MKKSISYTQYAMYLRCPRQWEYRYVEEKKMPPSSSLLLGKGTHRGLEWSFKEHLGKGQSPSKKTVQEATASCIEKEISLTPKSEIIWSKGDTEGKLIDDGVKLINVYDPERVKLTPLKVEESFEIPFSNVEYTLNGRVDLETLNSIIDFKTTKRKQPQESVDQSEQLTIYQLQDNKKNLEQHVLIRKKDPEYQILKSKPKTQNQINSTLENINKVANLIQAGIFPKIIENSPGSACSWCGYYELCRGKKRLDKV